MSAGSSALWAALLVLVAVVVLPGAGSARRLPPSWPTGGAGEALGRGRWRPPSWRWRPTASAPEQVDDADAALVLDLLAAAVGAGAAPVAALRVVGEAVGGRSGAALARTADLLGLGASPDVAWAGAPSGHAAVRRCLELAAATGAPVAALLTAAAAQERRRRARAGQMAAARLGVRVVLPLGLCALPGFAALGVVPVVLGLAGALLRG